MFYVDKLGVLVYNFKVGQRVVNVRNESTYFGIAGTILNIDTLTHVEYAVVQYDSYGYKVPSNFNSLIPESVYTSKLYKALR